MSKVIIDHHCNATKLASECRAPKKARLDVSVSEASHVRPRIGC